MIGHNDAVRLMRVLVYLMLAYFVCRTVLSVVS